MRLVASLALVFVSCAVGEAAAQHARLSVDLDLLPAVAQRADFQVTGSFNDDQPITFSRAGNEWRTSVALGKASSTKVDLRLDGSVPQGYVSRPLRVVIPYQPDDQSIAVRLVAAMADGSAAEARQLYQRGFSVLGARDLLAEYQRAWAIANYRRIRRGNDWPQLHDYDVQAVYKFLEAAILVAKKTVVVPDFDGDVALALQWLTDAYRIKPDRVLSALQGNKDLLDRLFGDISLLRAKTVTKVWGTILATTDLATQCTLLRQFEADFAELGQGVHDGLTQAHVLNAWSACLAKRSADAAVLASPDFVREMSEVSIKLAGAAESVGERSLKARTFSHYASLSAILSATKQQQ